MADRLGWGIVGCGWVGRDLAAPAIASAGNAALVAVCDPDAARRQAMADRYEGVTAVADVDALLDLPGVDAIYVATPNDSHAAITIAAARAGRHVLCEKPMATNAADAREMVAACAGNGVVYATAFDQRYHAAHRRLAALIAAGELGTITTARIHYACWLDGSWTPWQDEPHDNWRVDRARAGGGALIDLAPHGIDLLAVLLGSTWDRLCAVTQQQVHGYDVDDGAALAGRLACGTLAVLTVGYNCPDALPRRRLEVYGTAAMAEAIDTMGQTAGGQLALIDAATGERRTIRVDPDEDRSPFLHEIEAFGAAVLDGMPLPSTPEQDLYHVELLEAACH